MPKSFLFIVPVYCALLQSLYSQSVGTYQHATVIHVREYALPSTYIEDTGIGAPQLPDVYKYDIAIQLACGVYTGRYQSDKQDLPPILAQHRTMEVRVEKRFLHVRVDHSHEIEMRIVRHRRAKRNGCNGQT
jgi:hypothetical protein